MIPKKHKVIIEETAKQLDLDINLVQDLTSFYWSKVRKSLSDLDAAAINIEGLGKMYIKPLTLKKVTEKYKAILKNINPKYFSNVQKIKDLEIRIERLDKVAIMLEEQNNKRNLVKTKRYEKDNKDLENPETNLGGN